LSPLPETLVSTLLISFSFFFWGEGGRNRLNLTKCSHINFCSFFSLLFNRNRSCSCCGSEGLQDDYHFAHENVHGESERVEGDICFVFFFYKKNSAKIKNGLLLL
jgi:hypothetical protein